MRADRERQLLPSFGRFPVGALDREERQRPERAFLVVEQQRGLRERPQARPVDERAEVGLEGFGADRLEQLRLRELRR